MGLVSMLLRFCFCKYLGWVMILVVNVIIGKFGLNFFIFIVVLLFWIFGKLRFIRIKLMGLDLVYLMFFLLVFIIESDMFSFLNKVWIIIWFI